MASFSKLKREGSTFADFRVIARLFHDGSADDRFVGAAISAKREGQAMLGKSPALRTR
jgi:hypothetical protein